MKIRKISNLDSGFFWRQGRSLPNLKIYGTTWLLLIGFGMFAAIGIGWAVGNPTITSLATQAYQAQLNRPWFVTVPDEPERFLLTGMFIALFAIVLGMMGAFPKPNWWTRAIVAGILIALSLRYVLWRTLATLNLNTPQNGMFALALLLLEVPFILTALPLTFWLPTIRDRSREADRYQILVTAGEYVPTVDIFIPTYNEPERIVRRTILGCQAIDYPHKTIYVLDDGQRSSIKELTQALGCEYISRSDRQHAKAGNLNHALAYTYGELIAVFDADFIPTYNFLHRTVGFFQQSTIGLVQTHQNFYNPDPIVRNLGLARYLTVSREEFSRKVQPTLDSIGSTICDGSGFVIRRRDLETIGGFVTESLTEDYFTGMMLDSQHQRVIYLDENLSAGLAAESLSDYIRQYQRWLNGSLQAFFIRANPLTLKGLTLRQRLGHLAHLTYWLTSFFRLLIILTPLMLSLAHVMPIVTTADDIVFFLLIPLFFNLLCINWLSDRSASFLLSEIYGTIHAIPFSITALQTLLNPFGRGFLVTPKGVMSPRLRFNIWLSVPLAILWLANAVTLVNLVWQTIADAPSLAMAFPQLEASVMISGVWAIYNMMIVGLTILACVEAPKVEAVEWFQFERPVALHWGDRSLAGMTLLASEVGLRVRLTTVHEHGFPLVGDRLNVEFHTSEWQGTPKLTARVTNIIPSQNHQPEIELAFTALTIDQSRSLIAFLFCRPGQWLRRQHPNDLQMAIVLIKQVFYPRFTRTDERAEDAIPIG